MSLFQHILHKFLHSKGYHQTGYHGTAAGEVLKISEMTDEHLKNAIGFGTKFKDGHKYWDAVVPQFKRELEKRSKSWT